MLEIITDKEIGLAFDSGYLLEPERNYVSGYRAIANAQLQSGKAAIENCREKIAQATRTLLFSCNAGTDYIEPIAGEFADQIIKLILEEE